MYDTCLKSDIEILFDTLTSSNLPYCNMWDVTENSQQRGFWSIQIRYFITDIKSKICFKTSTLNVSNSVRPLDHPYIPVGNTFPTQQTHHYRRPHTHGYVSKILIHRRIFVIRIQKVDNARLEIKNGYQSRGIKPLINLLPLNKCIHCQKTSL